MAEPWARPSGLPTTHVAQAALQVAAILGAQGSHRSAADESYWHHATGGTFPPDDLKRGEMLLIACDLITERDGVLYPSAELGSLLRGSMEDAQAVLADRALLASQPAWIANRQADPDPPEELRALVPDPDRREELLLALARTFDDTQQRALGAAGENLVVATARDELAQLGYHDLARAVRRVSLLSDQLGYDVSAPRVDGTRRLLEVKSTRITADPVTIHLTRNEARTAGRFVDWFLVVCVIADAKQATGHIAGWCTSKLFAPRLPSNTDGGWWEQAAVQLPLDQLSPGLPRAVS